MYVKINLATWEKSGQLKTAVLFFDLYGDSDQPATPTATELGLFSSRLHGISKEVRKE